VLTSTSVLAEEIPLRLKIDVAGESSIELELEVRAKLVEINDVLAKEFDFDGGIAQSILKQAQEIRQQAIEVK
jgi:hypothetical protein